MSVRAASAADGAVDPYARVFELLERLALERRPDGRPCLVAIDGINAAGKTTFAAAFAAHLVALGLTAHVVHVDDFHHPRRYRYATGHNGRAFYERYIDFDRLVADVLQPLRREGRLGATLQLLDVPSDELTLVKTFHIEPDSIVLVEGIFVLRRDLRSVFDLRVYLDTSFSISIARGRRRWTHLPGAEVERRFRRKYLPGQTLYLKHHRPRAAADVIIDNEVPTRPAIVKAPASEVAAPPSAARAAVTTCDVVFVGGGFRTTTFLAAIPELLAHDVAVVERRGALGAGAFHDYATTSSSVGSRFLRLVRRPGRFESAFDDPELAAIAAAEAPVDLLALGRALSRLGEILEAELGEERTFLRSQVVEVEASSARPASFRVRLDSGEEIRARACVMATGRRERPHPALLAWREKMWLSCEVISDRRREELMRALRAASGGLIAVLGGSHSAFSALGTLLRATESLVREDVAYELPRIVIAHRSPVRLCYDSVDQARREQVAERELPFDEAAHVCPATGIVFRDSGLRHEARALFCAAWEGTFANVSLDAVASIDECNPLLREAALVVQALGYAGVAPPLVIDGRRYWDGAAPPGVVTDTDGRVLLRGEAAAVDLYALRVEPTPRALRDNANYASDLYARLGERLLDLLDRSPARMAAS